MLAFFTGLIAGAGHVASGPDHWAAVAPLSADKPGGAIRLGLRWGLGHGVGVLVMGAIGIVLKASVNLDMVSSFAEVVVGVTLVLTGAWAVSKSRSIVVHSHPHEHGDHEHAHYHLHTGRSTIEENRTHNGHAHAASGIGLLHGIAGSGHVWGLLPSLTLPTIDAIFYLSAFILSSMLSMALFSYCLGRFLKDKSLDTMRGSLRITGVGAILVGSYWFLHSLA